MNIIASDKHSSLSRASPHDEEEKVLSKWLQVDGMKLANLVRYILQTFFLIGSDLVKYLSLSNSYYIFKCI